MKNLFKPFLALSLMLAIAFSSAAPADAYYAKQVWQRMSCTAGETLTSGNIVAIKAADGKCYKADADDATLRPAVGLIGKGGAASAAVEVIITGIITGWTGQTIGAPGYMSGTAGAVTQAAPAYTQKVGVAISATDYYINIQNYFDTSAVAALAADVTQTGVTPTYVLGDGDDERLTMPEHSSRMEKSQVLAVAEQLQATLQYRVVDGLAAMVVDGSPLNHARYPHRDVQVPGVAAGECRAQLGVESFGDGPGQRPREHRRAGGASGASGGEGCLSGPVVVGVAGDPAQVEDEQVARVFLVDHPQHVAGEFGQRHTG